MAPLKRSREAKPPVTLGGRTVQGEGAVGAEVLPQKQGLLHRRNRKTARSVSLSWGARDVGSPCEWRGERVIAPEPW